mmetsp:Transcript_19694/g.27470  ORF Transcript_19694/g.27470 Transcript_19694/m.27470 type:complete len:145 (-) Transcript_19694:24-458(-)
MESTLHPHHEYTLPNQINENNVDSGVSNSNTKLDTPSPLKIQQNDTPKIRTLKHLLNKKIEVEITDGRTFTGKFYCVDKQQNLILGETLETQKKTIATKDHPEGKEKMSQKHVGLVTIPGRHIVSVHLELPEGTTLQNLDQMYT